MPAAGGDGRMWVTYFRVLLLGGGALSLSLCVLFLFDSQSQPSLLIRATVDSATLSRLTVVVSNSDSAAVSYHLAVRLKLSNPGGDEANIYYDAMDASLRFRGAVIGPAANDTSPSVFFQRSRSRTGQDVKLEFDYGRRGGGGGVSVPGDVAAEMEKGMRSAGAVTFELELDVLVRVGYAPGGWKLREKPRIRCSMTIPVKPDGRGALLASGERYRVNN
ncbi:unnamed protein product [Urochloa humidicola]